METVLAVLKPIVEMTEVMEGEKRITISAVRPLLQKLLCKHLVESSTDSQLIKTLKKVVLTDLKNRYDDPAVKVLLNKSCFLDPHFKALTFLSQEQRHSTVAMIKKEVQEVSSTQELAEPPQKRQH